MRISSFKMWVLAIAAAGLAACGDDGGNSGDDAPPVDSSPTVDAPANELTCANYCTKVTANCTAANNQFSGMPECMASCMRYPTGALTDMTGHTLGCRIYHAGAPAMTTPDTHCRHAGPGGYNGCGEPCLDFCTLVLGACTGANAQYAGSMATCMTACGAYAQTPVYDASQTAGNTYACRLWHATKAAVDPVNHCKHTAVVSATCN